MVERYQGLPQAAKQLPELLLQVPQEGPAHCSPPVLPEQREALAEAALGTPVQPRAQELLPVAWRGVWRNLRRRHPNLDRPFFQTY